jgi:hypothetical protein
VCCVLYERGVLFCVMCVICVLCLIVVPQPPGKTPFAAKINNNNNIIIIMISTTCHRHDSRENLTFKNINITEIGLQISKFLLLLP